MEPLRTARLVTALSAVVLLAGLSLALVYSAAESVLNPGYSLVDGYWRGGLPWMGIIEALVVSGATAAILAGTVAVAARGGWARRAATLALAAVAGLWWFSAAVGAGMSRAACNDCPPPVFDPWVYAYSAPVLALQMLILPAAAIVLLALGRRSAE
ncbi:MAG: hypothetical protein M3Y40_08880 [Chloroflexota bacterium]|nr:hypothetical protein [Chloroflexota bacterium]